MCCATAGARAVRGCQLNSWRKRAREVPGLYQFPKEERLTRRREYADVYERGEKVVGRAFVCYQVRRDGQGRKFGVTVSRKVGKAVTRNRIKRYLREIYRTNRPHLKPDICLVVVARPTSAAMSFGQCREAMGTLLRQGMMLNE